ncbi:MAG: SBBP repeat-containing protein [Alicyclobacillus macrosporangiidus]|uniref:DUF7948 domain-containing protein n=1 Tax=Alicyclobacillus macrosporangiidus TaxID=392015 RepID=UPI0026EC8B15|nr:SBBP repeat-containing protein [Alicyclobacillus macrosporangiidus]MCL6599008.1 SBBP repeat-containing protein [Alicyclobacillus macrosporangiidus]
MSVPAETQQKLWESYVKLPLTFIPNAGQVHPDVLYYMQRSGRSFYFTREQAVFTFMEASSKLRKRFKVRSKEREKGESESPLRGTALALQFVGANLHVQVEGQNEAVGKVNYFIGDDSTKWVTDLPTYHEVVYRELWPGIDLLFTGKSGRLKSEFIVQPGANIEDIRLRYRGAERLSLDEAGNLEIHTPYGILLEERPVSMQEIEGQQVPMPSSFLLQKDQDGEWVYGMQVGHDFDTRYPLIIDPTLIYSTYLGGSDFDEGIGIAVDISGSAYVTGATSSLDFPTQNPFQGAFAGGNFDVFVTKFSPTGNTLLYSTYLGGSGDDVGNGIAVDSSGSAYVTGDTSSTNFPTQNPFQGALAGGDDAFVAKLSPAGNTLLYSTYLGGSTLDVGNGIAVDDSGAAYVTGVTDSTNFPTQNPFQGALAGGDDAFVTKLSPAGNTLLYSTYLGGSGTDFGNGIAVDSSGFAYVTGFTDSPDFPTQNPFQGALAGGIDGFVTKLSPAGNTLLYSTYLGGSGDDEGFGIAVDASGLAYVTGATNSPDFPTQNPFQGALAGGFDAIVTKFSPAGNTLVYSTYLGGSGDDFGFGIAVDSSGSAYATGQTNSLDFPTQNPFQGSLKGIENAFVTKLSPAGNTLLYSTYLGGSGFDEGFGIAVDSGGSAYVTGLTDSPDFPTQNPFQGVFVGGLFDAFVTKIGPFPCIPNITLNITQLDPCTFEIRGTVTCSGAPVPGATVSFTSSEAGTGSVSITPNPTTTDGLGNFAATMMAAPGTLGTATVLASTTVNGIPVSSTQSMPVNCPIALLPNDVTEECIRVDKVYDWVVISDVECFTFPFTCAATPPFTITACFVTAASATITSLTPSACTVNGVSLSLATLLVTAVASVSVEGADGTSCTVVGTNTVTDCVCLCVPTSVGTFSATIPTPSVFFSTCTATLTPNATSPTAVIVTADLCKEVEVVVPGVKLAVLAKFCEPRPNVTTPFTCPPFMFPTQCPALFPIPNCTCQATAQMLTSGQVTIPAGVIGELILMADICPDCDPQFSTVNFTFSSRIPDTTHSFIFTATAVNPPLNSRGDTCTTVHVTGIGTQLFTGLTTPSVSQGVAFDLTLTSSPTLPTYRLVLSTDTGMIVFDSGVASPVIGGISTTPCKQFPSPM